MTKELLILRHAKSSWATPDQDDHDRPLNKRGRDAAEAMGAWLRDNDHVPDQILCSSARRTCETVERMGLSAPQQILTSLYLADPEVILSELRRAIGERVMIVGHNPGIAAFAAAWLTAEPEHIRFRDFPTCALSVSQIEFDDWSTVTNGRAQSVNFLIPDDIGAPRGTASAQFGAN